MWLTEHVDIPLYNVGFVFRAQLANKCNCTIAYVGEWAGVMVYWW